MPAKQTKPNMCSGCTACCCALSVDLTTYDIFRIFAAEQKQLSDFVQLVFAEPSDPHAFKLKLGFVKAVLKREFGFCTFFDPTRILRCTVEGSKPSICMEYPFLLLKNYPILREDGVCPPFNIQKADAGKMSAATLSDCEWELARYVEIVSDWNILAKGDETFDKFLNFSCTEMCLEQTPWGSAYRRVNRIFRKFQKKQ